MQVHPCAGYLPDNLNRRVNKPMRLLLTSLVLLFLSGCVNVGGKMADVLSGAVLNQRDPATVRDGLPAYLLLLDGMILEEPDNVDLLAAGSRLYGAYAGAFVKNPRRMQLMSGQALQYARRAMCPDLEVVCSALDKPLDQFRQALTQVQKPGPVYYYAVAWAGWIQANSDDWQAIADLPKVEAMMSRVLQLDETYDHGGAHLYMGVLLTLRPASLGGQPEQGRRHFERALELSQDHNLMVKVLYAKYYARLVFDQKLHDRLLNEVLAADPDYPDLTLMNVLAQEQAQQLLDSSKDYF